MSAAMRPLVSVAMVMGLVIVAVAPGMAMVRRSSAAVVDGNARFQVLSPTLVRLEYASDGGFEDRPTFNAVNRNLGPPQFTTAVENGERVIRTDQLTLRYRQKSGPFTAENLQVDLTANHHPVVARPSWELADTCGYSVLCEAETLWLSGGARMADDAAGFTGPGFVSGLTSVGAGMAWRQRGLPADGQYNIEFRYASAPDDGATQSMVVTDGEQSRQIFFAPTGDWGNWAVSSVTMRLPAGETPIRIECQEEHQCAVDIDSVAVTATGVDYPPKEHAAHATANLGGWRRSLDGADGPRPLYDGLLSRDGWYLLNDTETAVRNPDGSVTARPRNDEYQDGYFFGYGHDYRQGLADLRDLTGPPAMLPRWAFGNWFSRYYPYSDAQYRDEILPAFRENRVPLDVLVVDTDFKAPNNWNGWDWNPEYFPDPHGFFDWARAEGLQVSLNIHPSISAGDPKYADVKEELGYDLPQGVCVVDTECRVFDFSDPAQLRAYFNLHRPFEELGPVVWWLDPCCDSSGATTPGLSPDSWINAQYAARADAQGRRGFSWSRSGSGYTRYGETAIYPAGPWADHRYTVDTSMDTTATWDMLSFESYYTVRRGNIGIPYESHDIGGHNYAADNNRLPEDLYARWVQFGAFQPVLRLHSNHGYRLPWDYPPAAQESAQTFMRLHEALIPYAYTLARQAYDFGLPMARGLYLNYPEYPEAYSYDRQYLYGDDLLVAPVTTPGIDNVETTVWFPPGTWVDYFTGRSYVGPGVETVTTDLSTMPVFLRAGGILPTRTDDVDYDAQRPLDQVTLDIAAGGSGTFSLYEDAGDGHGYRDGQFGRTSIRYVEDSTGEHGTVAIAGLQGSFPGAVAQRAWTVKFRNIARPASVAIGGSPVSASDDGPGWTYDAGTRTLTVRTAARATNAPTTVTYTAGP